MTNPEACELCGASLPSPGAACPQCAVTDVSGRPPEGQQPARTRPGGLDSAAETIDAAPRPSGAAPAGPARIAGYRILRELGAGGMGSVYEAYDEKMKRTVALKVMAGHLAPSQKAGLRFEQEAWIAGKLDHPNLVKVYDRGAWQDLRYFAMELVDGGSLHDVIQNLKKSGRDAKWDLEFGSREYIHWAINQVIAAARGLDYAHRQGVVHRDVKPLNLLLSREQGTVKIADFGLAIDIEVTRMTTAGKMLGTPVYMAPEQLLGRTDAIGVATDIYALGVTLFELLTLELPYEAATQQQYLTAAMTQEARRASKINVRVSRDLETVIHATLEKDPTERYRTAAALADDLERVLDLRPIEAKPPSALRRMTQWIRRKPIHAALLAVLTLAIPTLSLLGYLSFQQQQLLRESRIEELWRESNWLVQSSRYSEGMEKTSEILRLDPDHLYALRSRALSATAVGASDPALAAALQQQALDDLARILALEPDASWPHRLQAFVLASFGREREASEAEAVALQKRSGEPSDDDLYLDAQLAQENEEQQRSVDLLSELIGRRPNKVEAISLRAEAYKSLGELDRAIADYRVVAGLNPRDFYPPYHLGRLLKETGYLDEASDYLRRALEIQPGSPYVHEALSDNHLERGKAGDGAAALIQFQQAEREARLALEGREDLPWAHLNLGASLMEQYRLLPDPDAELAEEAILHYERARELAQFTEDSADALAYAALNLCDALIQIGDHLLQLLEGNGALLVRDRLGIEARLEPYFQVRGRQLQRAVEICEAVVAASPDDPVAHYNLAGVYAQLGRTDEALASLERDLALGDYDFGYLESDPWFESMRDDPRLQDLLERMRVAARNEE